MTFLFKEKKALAPTDASQKEKPMSDNTPRQLSRSETLTIRGLNHHVRHWGRLGSPKLFLIHGWMDSSPTFQFMVDALSGDWHVIAPDLRGFGQTQWLNQPYWFPDYYADLHDILKHYTPDAPALLVGHSMGAAIASSYAAMMPQRVAKLVMIDFLGIKPSKDANPTDQLSKWLKDFEDPPKLRLYKSFEALAGRLKSVNGRLTQDRAEFLARHVGKALPDGQVAMACDPWHKTPSAFIYRMDDSQSVWRRIKAPTLMLMADFGYVRMRYSDDEAQYQTSLNCFENLQAASILNSGHNVQHDQPEVLAAFIEQFLLQPADN